MDANDYVIKRRLVQSMEFVTTEFIASTIDVAPEALEAYYEAHRDDYFIEPFVTFTHVFFSSKKHGPDAARSLAQSKLETLNAQKTGFADSGEHGDRFAYSRNYVERNPQFVASHFGAGMADALFELTPDESTWQGPIASESGFHVVLLTRRETGRYPELREIEERVRDDARRDAISARQAQAIRSLVDTYEVRIDLDRGRGDTI